MVKRAKAIIESSNSQVKCLNVDKILLASTDYELTLSSSSAGSLIVSVRDSITIKAINPSLIYLQSRVEREEEIELELEGNFEVM